MKKIFYVLTCFLFSLSIVNAKTEIKYEWGKSLYSGYEFYTIGSNSDGIVFNTYKYDDANTKHNYSFFKFDKEGNFDVTPYTTTSDKRYYQVNNKIITKETIDGTNYIVFYDEEMTEIKKIEGTLNNTTKIEENEEYYMIGDIFFSKKADEIIPMEEFIGKENIEKMQTAIDGKDEEVILKTYLEILKEKFYWTVMPSALYYEAGLSEHSDLYLRDISINKKGDFANIFYLEDDKGSIIDIHNKDYELIKSITLEEYAIKVLFREEKLYILAGDSQDITNSDGTTAEVWYLKVYEYDTAGNKLDEFELNNLIQMSEDSYIEYIVDSGDGFYALVQNDNGVGNGPSDLSAGSIINGDDPVLLKFTFNYDIQVNNDGNGDIEIVKSSKPGEGVTFKVTPKEGYELKEIRVTDANGNVLIVTDYEFTMPSSDVTIDAVFQKKIINPETADIMILGFIVLALLGSYVAIKKSKKLQWLNN